MVLPETATEKPSASFAAPSEAKSFADSVRVPVQPPTGSVQPDYCEECGSGKTCKIVT